MNKIVSIQYLRAIAALMVVMFHAFYPSHANFRIAGGNFFQFGRMGVDIFFILSGFVMSLIIATEKTPTVFIKKRMVRIYPT
jgi:exopolysaccharide production protein ExoZ